MKRLLRWVLKRVRVSFTSDLPDGLHIQYKVELDHGAVILHSRIQGQEGWTWMATFPIKI